jgi:hypothetical protein
MIRTFLKGHTVDILNTIFNHLTLKAPIGHFGTLYEFLTIWTFLDIFSC